MFSYSDIKDGGKKEVNNTASMLFILPPKSKAHFYRFRLTYKCTDTALKALGKMKFVIKSL